MQTIKKVKYNIERVGNNTFCTMSCDLEYIMDYLEGANVEVSSADTSVFLRIASSKERKIFIKNLTSWGLTIDNSTIIVVAKITLSKNDKDDQVVANRIVRDKAMHTMCKVVANALNQALDSTYNRLAKVNNIINKLNYIAYHSKYNENDTTCDIEDCPDPEDDYVDIADIL
jgi:hypothetical protein